MAIVVHIPPWRLGLTMFNNSNHDLMMVGHEEWEEHGFIKEMTMVDQG